MKRQWDIEELIEHFTLVEEDKTFLESKTGAPLLGCALLLKCFEYEARFPSAKYEIPRAVIDYVARQLKVDANLFAQYDWDGRTMKLHRTQIREHLKFREVTAQDSEKMTSWLIETHLSTDQKPDHLKAKVLTRFRDEGIEPPTMDRIERLIRSACSTYEQMLFQTVSSRLTPETRAQLDQLLERSEQMEAEIEVEEEEQSHREITRNALITWRDLKTNPGAVGLESILSEIDKLRVLSQLALPPDLFGDASQAVVGLYRQRAATETHYELRRHPDAIRFTLLAAFCLQRRAEITDSLVELLLHLIQQIGARAEKRVTKELLDELRSVTNKPRLLYQVAEAALAHPDETIRKEIFRVMSEEQCKAIVQEYKTKGGYHQQVYLCMRSSYRNHYRRMVPLLVNMLEIHSSNSVHQPVIRALELIKRYADTAGIWYPAEEDVPVEGVIRPMWEAVVLEKDKDGEQRINRVNYELCVLEALRDGLRCRELWVTGANKYRNPGDDLPQDWASRREEYYQALEQPKLAQEFVERLQHQMRVALDTLDRAMPRLAPKVHLSNKNGGWIHLSPLEAQPEPQYLRKLKAEVGRRWGMTNLLDILKEADLRIGFTRHFKSPATRQVLDRETLQKRLLLCLYGMGDQYRHQESQSRGSWTNVSGTVNYTPPLSASRPVSGGHC
jgi:hypothetical protein